MPVVSATEVRSNGDMARQTLVPSDFLKAGLRGRLGNLALGSLVLALALVPACAQETVKGPTTPPQEEALRVDLGKLAPLEPHSSVAVEADDPRLGPEEAPVTVVSFLDYQCGGCRLAYRDLRNLQKEQNDVRLVFKHLPSRRHPMSFPAAVVAQAVMQELGSEAFFEFSDLVYAHQGELSIENLSAWAAEVGLSTEKYNQQLQDASLQDRVIQDAIRASQLNLRLTPTLFVNGRMLEGAQSANVMAGVIEDERAALAELGLPWKEAYRSRVEHNTKGSLIVALLAEDKEDYRVPVEGSPVLGPMDAKVTVVMFTDFECPFCKQAEPTIRRLRQNHPDDVRIVFKHLPLGFHDHARPAALLAAAAQAHLGEEAFFRTARALFDMSPHLERADLERLGLEMGLSEEQVTAALDDRDPAANERLKRDQALADDTKARGTPHFFINGKRLSGAAPLEHFEALVQYGLERADALLEGGTPADRVYEVLQREALSPGAPVVLDAELPTDDRPTRGSRTAPVVVHVFSDFQCPFCRKLEASLTELDELYPGKLRVVWHDLPLPFHEHARVAARAGREAWSQGENDAFWSLHGAIFALDKDEARFTQEQILRSARGMDLNAEALESAMNDERHDAAIGRDEELAESLGIKGTPALVINQKLVTGAKPLRYLQRVIDDELSALEDRKEPLNQSGALR